MTRIGLTLDEHFDLRVKPRAGADPAFHEAAQEKRDRRLPMPGLGGRFPVLRRESASLGVSEEWSRGESNPRAKTAFVTPLRVYPIV